MDINWTKHLSDQEEKKNFERMVQSAKPVLDRLRAIVSEKGKALDRVELSEKAFDNPNWAYKQAYRNGYRASFEGFDNMINLDKRIITID